MHSPPSRNSSRRPILTGVVATSEKKSRMPLDKLTVMGVPRIDRIDGVPRIRESGAHMPAKVCGTVAWVGDVATAPPDDIGDLATFLAIRRVPRGCQIGEDTSAAGCPNTASGR